MEVVKATFFEANCHQSQNHSGYSRSCLIMFHFYSHFHFASLGLDTFNSLKVKFKNQFYWHLVKCHSLIYLSYVLVCYSLSFQSELGHIQKYCFRRMRYFLFSCFSFRRHLYQCLLHLYSHPIFLFLHFQKQQSQPWLFTELNCFVMVSSESNRRKLLLIPGFIFAKSEYLFHLFSCSSWLLHYQCCYSLYIFEFRNLLFT